MRVFVNGEERQAPDGISVSELVLSLELPHERIAVELNKSVVRRREWNEAKVREGDSVEIVHFVGGG